ncbi:MAG: RNA polymerase sigma factor [Anaerolineae bacterium]|nr:RNA polymerase sigma factor [Anaerolineae bacterium]
MSQEQALLRRIQQRGQHPKDAKDALAELYDLYARRVYSHVAMMLGENTAAQEVTQDTFMKVWQRPEQYHYDTGNFGSWLLTIAHRTAIDRVRHDRHYRDAQTDSMDEDDFPEIPDPGQAHDTAWREWLVVLARLPNEQRDVIVLTYYHGLSQSEIAAQLRLPLGTVKTRVRLAMEKLREWLRDIGQS